MKTYITRIERGERIHQWIKFTANGRLDAIKKSMKYADFYKGKHKGTLELDKKSNLFKKFELKPIKK